jgi:hypothetical protein
MAVEYNPIRVPPQFHQLRPGFIELSPIAKPVLDELVITNLIAAGLQLASAPMEYSVSVSEDGRVVAIDVRDGTTYLIEVRRP